MCFFALAIFSAAASFAAPKPLRIKVEAQPAHPVNGAACLFKVTTSVKLEELRGKWLGHDNVLHGIEEAVSIGFGNDSGALTVTLPDGTTETLT